MVQGGMSCVKYLMFIFNFIFLLSGIALMVIGGLAFSQSYRIFLDKAFVTGPSIIIAVGVIIFFISFLGCCGAIRENSCMVTTFAAFLFIIFVIEVAGGATAYVYREKLGDFLQDNMNKTIKEDKPDQRKVWDYMQKTWRCCGVTGPDNYIISGKTIPKSCCKGEVDVCTRKAAYDEGCYSFVKQQIKDNIITVGGVAIGIAVVELIGVMFACCLSAAIRRGGNGRYV